MGLGERGSWDACDPLGSEKYITSQNKFGSFHQIKLEKELIVKCGSTHILKTKEAAFIKA